MFVDHVSGIALWDDRSAEDDVEDRLPISASLQARIKAWVDDYARGIAGESTWSAQDNVDLDRVAWVQLPE